MSQPLQINIVRDWSLGQHGYQVTFDNGVGDHTVVLDPAQDLPPPPGVGSRAPEPVTLGAALERLVAAREGEPSLDPTAAAGLSQLLSTAIWNSSPRGSISELRIVTTDPFIASLPWPMARQPSGGQLDQAGIPVSIQIGALIAEAGIGPEPSILVCAPSPGLWPSTDALIHLDELREALPGRITERVPTNVAELHAALTEYKPDILYYYGHGNLLDQQTFDLVMQRSDPLLDADPYRIDLFASWLRAAPDVLKKLKLIYLNCCWGGTATPGGAPLHLGPLVPALISNRTSARIKEARNQATEILSRIVWDRAAPHVAVARAATTARGITELAGPPSGPRDEPWWITPVTYTRYRRWTEPTIPNAGQFSLNERLTLWLARASHVDEARLHLKTTQQPAVALMLWHAALEDGLEPLAERLRWELEATPLFKGPIAWPEEGKGDLDPRLRRLLTRRIEAQMNDNAKQGFNGTNGLAHAASDKLGPRGGRVSIQFAPVPADVELDRALVWIGAAADALGNAIALPIDDAFKGGEIRVIAFIPVAASELVEELPQSFTAATTSTKWINQTWLTELNPVRKDELGLFLLKFKDFNSDQYRQELINIRDEIYKKAPTKRYECIRQVLHDYDFP